MRQAANYHTENNLFPRQDQGPLIPEKNQILCRELDVIDTKQNSPRGRMTEGAMRCTDQRLPYSELDQICDLVGNYGISY
jgi:hypothetical protein